MTSRADQAEHFVDVLDFYAERQPDQLLLRHLTNDETPQLLSYAQLRNRALSLAGCLQERLGEARGERCVLLLPSGPDYAAAFFACLYAGVIAVPAFPPENNRQMHIERLRGMLDDAKPRVVLGERACLAAHAETLRQALPEGALCLAVEDIDATWALAYRPQIVDPAALAFLQYTSGSTSAPKGVMVSHANLIANEKAMQRGFLTGRDEGWVSWLPLYHDMGLMLGLLLPIFHGGTLTLMSPNHFLTRPARWLQAISQYGGTISGGPDFAYRLCVERVSDSALAELDLSRWSMAFSGSEPIRVDTLDAFCERFAAAGFRRQALTPAYGLAEATLYVCAHEPVDDFRIRRFAGEALGAAGAEAALQQGRLAGCGWCDAEHALSIVDPQTLEPLGENRAGEVWVAGPSLAQGYWNNPSATAAAFVERDGRRWLRTGDLGIAAEQGLYIAGRLKDLIILNGQNLYPQDVELLLEEQVADYLRRGRVAAFALEGEAGREGIGLALEISRNVRRLVPTERICTALVEALTQAFQVAPSAIALLEPGTLPRTTSGKLQRSACRAGWLAGTLDSFAEWRDGRLARQQPEPAAQTVLPAVRTAWAEVLNRAELAADVHFFAQGGDSVAVVQVQARLRDTLGVAVDPALLFAHPTLAAFSAQVAALPREAQPEGPLAQGDERAPQSFAQQRLWFLDQLEPGKATYHLAGEIHLAGTLDVARLERALETLVQRHAALRTRFDAGDGEVPEQRIEALAQGAVEHHDLSRALDRDATQAELVRSLVRRPLDLREGPLWRMALVRHGADDHRLVLVLHHIIADGWSIQVLLEDFAVLYQTEEGQAPALAPLSITYADFARWQRHQLTGAARERQLAYWRAQLADAPARLDLACDRPRPPRQSGRGARFAFSLSETASQGLRELAQRQGATLFMVGLALFQLLLQRHSGSHDLCVGVPVAGRTRRETERLIGFFVNTQVLRCQLDGTQSFKALLAQVRTRALEAQAHQDLPFDLLVEALAPERHLGWNPLCQVKFTQQFPLPQGLDLGGVTLSARQLDDGAAHFDLGLDITDVPSGIEAVFTYACDLFDASRIAALAADFAQLAQQVVADAEQPLARYRLAAEAVGLEGERQAFPAADLLALWRAGLRQAGPGAAVMAADASLSHAQLDADSNRLARALRAQGVGAEVRVALCQPRQASFVVGLLGILKAGGACVFLDPKWPEARQAQVVADSGARLLLGAPQPEGPPSLALDAAADWRRLPADALDVVVQPAQAAYLIYTSGTTGRPKGVVVSHGAIANYVQGVLQRLALPPQASFALVSTVAADLGHTVLFGALATGGTLHLVDDEVVRDADRCAGYFANHPVAVLKIVPTQLAALLQAAEPARLLPHAALVLGGEALPAQLAAQVRQLKPGCRLFNHYGPTESTVGALTAALDDPATGIALGTPLPNLRARVLDADLNALPAGAAGELYLGGPGLARGYQGRPGDTAAVFLPDPWAPGERLYRTGDRVRLAADGRLEFLGRSDDQLKVRGYRVAPGEIVAALLAQPGITAAHVQLDGRGQLVAYVTGDTKGERLREILARQLPEALVPAQVLVLAAFPLTANGKLDRARLPQPEARQAAFAEPQGEVEAALATLWSDALKVDRVGRHDNFFALGGDSILSLQIIARARRQGLKLTPKQLFEHQTIAALAEVAAPAGAPVTPPAIKDPMGDLPLTPIQARFFSEPVRQRAHWNQSVVMELAAPLEAEVLRQALAALVARHSSLRLAFEPTEQGGWRQRVRPVEDAQRLLWTCQVATETELAPLFEEAERSLDLARGPLLRAVLAEGPERHPRLLLVIHHLAVDGVSWRILLDELALAYQQLAGGTPPGLGEASSDWSAWAHQMAQRAADAGLQRQRAYWEAVTAVPETLPCSHPQGTCRVRDSGTLAQRLSVDLTDRLLAVSGTEAVLLAALADALRHWTGRAATRIALEGHGREDLHGQLDLSRTLGWFTCLYPLVLGAEATPTGTLARVRRTLAEVPERGLGYGLLRYLADTCLADIREGLTFNYLGRFERPTVAGFPLRQLELRSSRDPDGPLTSALVLDARVYDGQLRLDWRYSTARFEASAIARLHEGFTTALEALLATETGNVPEPALEAVLPLAPMQEGILMHSLLEPGSGIYLMQDRYALRQPLAAEAFRLAWDAVVARHPALRTGFQEQDGEWRQVVHRQVPSPVSFLDFSDRPREEGLAALEALLAEERREGFDFARPPLLRLRLVTFGPNDHQLVQTHHHVLIDAWCRGLMLGEFFARYRAALAGTALTLPPARPYADFLAWLQAQDAAAGRAWWQAELAGVTAATPLPYRRPGTASGEMRDEAVALSAEATHALATQARRHQLTANTFVQAAWALVLMRHAGCDEVVFGVTVAGRPPELDGIEEALGLFINTLPLRVARPTAEVTALELLRRLQTRNVELRQHEHLPLAELQRLAAIPPGEPLFESLFVFENVPLGGAVEEAVAEFGITPLANRTHTNYPLTVVLLPGRELRLQLTFDTGLFAAADMRTLLGQFERLLGALIEAPERPLDELDPLAASEYEQLLAWGRGAVQPHWYQLSWIERFEARAAHHLQRLVARCGEETLSYGELDERAGRLGRALAAEGIGPDQIVALCAPRGVALLTLMVGVFKAGAAYLALDERHPQARSAQLLDSSATPVLVVPRAERATAEAVLALCERRPRLLILEELLARHPVGGPGVRARPDQLAYVIFTSGSTGEPKGVMVTQQGMLNNQLSKLPYLQLGEEDVIAQTAATGFDVSVWQFLTAPLFGGQVEIVAEAEVQDPAQLLARVTRGGVSVLECVPAVIAALLDLPHQPLPALRWLLPTGEALAPDLAGRWLQRYPQIPLVNAYGPAECADDVALQRLRVPQRDIPIGTPTDNTRLFVLDERLRLVPQGGTGELYIGGTGVGRGYLGRPGLTAERFVPSPFTAGERLYRSGDLVRWSARGELEYVGRTDFQIKVRGQRLEPGEIETLLRTQPGIRDAAVAAQPTPQGIQLVAYLEPQGSERPDLDALRACLTQRLPLFMVPTQALWLERLPRNANGKLDRRALPVPELPAESQQPPQGATERQLAELWQELLQVPEVGREADFFALGGHSLLATRLLSRVHERLGVRVPLAAAFTATTLTAQAELIDTLREQTLDDDRLEALNALLDELEETP
ncbi:non-ribosomal peptide synthetase [Pseudomonas sp. JBR1]|uniref:non-ribosomal peptide synthetase n=1 Tax=Pseudomonas sp. JBR1 TaxID=3020907 RepID=UPI002304DD31|nr:non-ribosomal peptide synthetase [Pseudomonas sp. JBR1]WCE09921.1 amino acid adenylation domain-containing protein [Pseudomonas sp. JBR1]